MSKNRKIGDLFDFERGPIVGPRLTGASVIKKCHIIRCIESDSCSGVVSIHKSWEDNISEEEQWAKINIDRKRSSYSEKDCFEKSQNYSSSRTEYSS
jgi:hypothetical protein